MTGNMKYTTIFLMAIAAMQCVAAYDASAGVDDWTVADVKKWAYKVSSTHAAAFEEHGIDGNLLLIMDDVRPCMIVRIIPGHRSFIGTPALPRATG